MAGYQFSQTPVETTNVQTDFRRIQTPIPVPESLPLLAALEKFESRSMHGQLPLVWDRAEGFQVHDAWGNSWIDFTSTIISANVGHAHARVIEALQAQLEKPLLHTYSYATQIRADYLRALIDATSPQFEKAFLLSAGTEATECALKLMRLHGYQQGKRQPGLITIEGNWHGRTLGAQMLSHNPMQKAWVGYHDPHIFHLPFPYPWRADATADPRGFFRASIEALLAEHQLDPQTDLCGFMLETFQGWGALFYPPEFVQELMRFAHEHGLLVAFDEMQSGFGRTGKLFGYMHYDVEPDLLCCGKGASSSVPLSFVLGSQVVMDLPEIGSMSSTHSANPLACAAGLATLRALLEDGLLDASARLGKQFRAGLEALQTRFPRHISQVMGHGLVAALHFVDPDAQDPGHLCSRICEEALRRGLLVVHTGRESIKLAPPLVIHPAALDEGVAVLGEVIGAVVEAER